MSELVYIGIGFSLALCVSYICARLRMNPSEKWSYQTDKFSRGYTAFYCFITLFFWPLVILLTFLAGPFILIDKKTKPNYVRKRELEQQRNELRYQERQLRRDASDLGLAWPEVATPELEAPQSGTLADIYAHFGHKRRSYFK